MKQYEIIYFVKLPISFVIASFRSRLPCSLRRQQPAPRHDLRHLRELRCPPHCGKYLDFILFPLLHRKLVQNIEEVSGYRIPSIVCLCVRGINIPEPLIIFIVFSDHEGDIMLMCNRSQSARPVLTPELL